MPNSPIQANLVIGCSGGSTRSTHLNFLLQIPNGSTLVETLTPGALQLATMVDSHSPNPKDHFATVAKLISSSRYGNYPPVFGDCFSCVSRVSCFPRVVSCFSALPHPTRTPYDVIYLVPMLIG